MFVNSASVQTINKPVAVGKIVFVQYNPNEKSTLTPISRANAIFEMAKCSFNQFRFKDEGIAILDRLARGCECYELKFNHVGDAVNLLKTFDTKGIYCGEHREHPDERGLAPLR